MHTVLLYSLTLMLAVLFSELAGRSILSASVLFLVAGICAAAAGWAEPGKEPVVQRIAEIALVATVFTDALRVPLSTLRHAWNLPGRALLLGLPLTLLVTALLAHYLTGAGWGGAFLVAAALSPTDPVLASAIVGVSRVPERLRQLLNVESGMNDGLALPAVLILLSTLKSQHVSWLTIGGELVGGILLGAAVPVACVWLYRRRILGAVPLYKPLFGLAVAMIVWSLCSVLNLNPFLGAFAAGISLASVSPTAREEFAPVGERLTELLKFAALLVFGILLSFEPFTTVGIGGWLFAAAVLFVARPAAILIALLRSKLLWRERLTAAWFGPRGFASVVFGLMILHSGIVHAQPLFRLVAVTVALSILLHSSTDVLVSWWFKEEESRDPNETPPSGVAEDLAARV